jgi:hypothetical protein
MKLHEKIKAQATELARKLNLPDSAIPQLTDALLVGATVALEHITEPEVKPAPAERKLVLVCDDADL